MSSGTDLIYGNVAITDCQTSNFRQTVIYDSSNTDAMYSQFSVSVEGTIHRANHPHNAGIVGTAVLDARSTFREIRDAMWLPRQGFVMTVDGIQILAATPIPGQVDTDVNNGPKPKNFQIIQIISRTSMRVKFDIEIAIAQCGYFPDKYDETQIPPGVQFEGKVISNRWEMSETRDSSFFTKRSWQGTLRVRHHSVTPHMMRHLVVPPLQKGYKRESMRFVQSRDGLSLNYEIEDMERHRSPPKPAIEWQASHTETLGVSAARSFGSIYVKLIGPPGVDKQQLLAAAANVVLSRVDGINRDFSAQSGAGDTSAVLMREASVVDYLHDTSLEMRVSVERVAELDTIFNMQTEQVGEDLTIDGYDKYEWISPNLFPGETPAGIYAMYLQNPCSLAHGITGVKPVEYDADYSGKEENEYEPQPETYVSPGELPELPDEPDKGLSSVQKTGFPYQHFAAHSEYVTDTGIVYLPYLANALADGHSVQTFQAHGGIARRILVVHVERTGKRPELPPANSGATDQNGIVETLVNRRIIPESPELMADGSTVLYKLQARYEYVLSRPPTEAEKLKVPVSPIDNITRDDALIEGGELYTSEMI